MSIAAKSRENCRAALVPNRCTVKKGDWMVACPRGWMISNERIFFYCLGGGEMLLGTFGTWQMGISCGGRKFSEYILNGKDMLNRYLATKGIKVKSYGNLKIKCTGFVEIIVFSRMGFSYFLIMIFIV